MSHEAQRLAALLEGLRRPRVLVAGDLMLDHYVFGKVERVSPEAPVPVLRVEREEWKPGGAGSVASMLRRLDADVAVVGLVGRDEAGDALVSSLEALGCDVSGILRAEGRPTTRKERVIANIQHLVRVDREVTDAVEPALEAALLAHVERLLPSCDLASCSDYGKGTFKGGLLPSLSARARALGRPVVLDPKKEADYRLYRGVTAITPNRSETEVATGIRPSDEAAWRRAGEKLVRDLDLEVAVMTLDRDGIFLAPREGEPRHFPTRARAVYDVTGAGDMVVSMLALARASGASWPDAIQLANAAAGVEVTRVGVAPLTRREVAAGLLERSDPFLEKIVSARTFVEEVLPELRRKRARIAFTNGCFDILHAGHVKLLQFARAQGDCLVVGLNSDRSVREIKGPGRPIIDEEQRAHLLAALAAVDHVIVFDEPTPLALIEAILPEALVKAEDYRGKTVVGQAAVEKAGGRVVLAPLTGGVSTTEILRRLQDADEASAAAARAAAEATYAAVEARARGNGGGGGAP
jgi:D-beta-D-heptose 7-phosphate kinase/D-beta-D-heptose 1-phosphate adenosyltransferase